MARLPTGAAEVLAESLGTFVMMCFGIGVNAQKTFSTPQNGLSTAGSYLAVNFGWGAGVFFGIMLAGKASGAHLNPAVSLSLWVHGRLPASRLVAYIGAQLAGSFVASAVMYAVYFEACQAYIATDHGAKTKASGGVWATYPQDFEGIAAGFLDQVFGTSFLMLGIFALGDEKNVQMSAVAGAACVACLVVAIGMCFGYNTGYAINPARDLAPRVFTWLAGWESAFTDGHGWWWVPCVAPLLGGVLGSSTYEVCIGWHLKPFTPDARTDEGLEVLIHDSNSTRIGDVK